MHQNHQTEKPSIQVEGGKLPEMLQQAEKALLTRSNNQIYQRCGTLVRIRSDANPPKGIKRGKNAPVIHQVETVYLIKRFTEVASWKKFDMRMHDWKEIDCPKIVAETYLVSDPWRVPVLTGILEAPTLRPDGTILDKPGYDQETGLLFRPGLSKFSSVPQSPTKKDAMDALDVYKTILSGFPFVDEVDFAVAMSAILTALIRHSIRTSPLHAFSAPKMGSGKSLLADSVAMITTGRTAAVMSQADSPEEEKKRLLAVLMEGDPVVCIDNVERPLGSDALCSVLTQETWKERLLGKNKTITVPTNITILATGNNLIFQGDLSTRALVCLLDPECERPEERNFEINLYNYIPENRDELVKAGLTILRAYQIAGKPKQDVAIFGRFEEWSNWVRSALLWIGLADPCESRKRIEDADPIRVTLRKLLMSWNKCTKNALTLKEVIEIAKKPGNEELYEALQEFAGDKKGEVDQRQVGRKFNTIQGRIEGGMRLEQFGKRQGTILWRVKALENQ